MPLHRIFVPRDLYSEQDKQAMTTAITEKVYGRIPAFYVVVLFITVEKGDYYVGAKQRDNFVRFAVENMARYHEGEKLKRQFIDRYEKALAPWTKDRGIDWEVQIEECNVSQRHPRFRSRSDLHSSE
ncbi:hypothetical protein FIBSPDRAFT_773652 [Athelia psychrophila]|uniref:Tautomerase cis-CaaD-like domain-containing protein n=1 Tax=Athelia psychrophila TaxID=1759441 RepID=A0A166VXI4_9AGAM|nr:hypothetical protein FIBSPDRAFT_773652 [Fibularhizoctonia sp. CBS 109695]